MSSNLSIQIPKSPKGQIYRKEPKWYINSSTGLVILKSGYIVEWAKFMKESSVHDLSVELNIECYNCERCMPRAGLKRTRDGLYINRAMEWGGEGY